MANEPPLCWLGCLLWTIVAFHIYVRFVVAGVSLRLNLHFLSGRRRMRPYHESNLERSIRLSLKPLPARLYSIRRRWSYFRSSTARSMSSYWLTPESCTKRSRGTHPGLLVRSSIFLKRFLLGRTRTCAT